MSEKLIESDSLTIKNSEELDLLELINTKTDNEELDLLEYITKPNCDENYLIESNISKPKQGEINLLELSIPKSIYDILLWKFPYTTGSILIACLIMEISFISFSLISVVAYTGLLFLITTSSIRLYCKLFSNADMDIIKLYLDNNISDNKLTLNTLVETFITKVNHMIVKIRSLVFVEDYVESSKLALFLYIMTFIGSKFNFMTICLYGTLGVFFGPKIYETYQVQIDYIYQRAEDKVSAIFVKMVEQMYHFPIIGQGIRRQSE